VADDVQKLNEEPRTYIKTGRVWLRFLAPEYTHDPDLKIRPVNVV